MRGNRYMGILIIHIQHVYLCLDLPPLQRRVSTQSLAVNKIRTPTWVHIEYVLYARRQSISFISSSTTFLQPTTTGMKNQTNSRNFFVFFFFPFCLSLSFPLFPSLHSSPSLPLPYPAIPPPPILHLPYVSPAHFLPAASRVLLQHSIYPGYSTISPAPALACPSSFPIYFPFVLVWPPLQPFNQSSVHHPVLLGASRGVHAVLARGERGV